MLPYLYYRTGTGIYFIRRGASFSKLCLLLNIMPGNVEMKHRKMCSVLDLQKFYSKKIVLWKCCGAASFSGGSSYGVTRQLDQLIFVSDSDPDTSFLQLF
jgi:hypothetical protein